MMALKGAKKVNLLWNPGQETQPPNQQKLMTQAWCFLTNNLAIEGSQGRLISLLDQTRDSPTIPVELSSISKWDESENPLAMSGQGTCSPSLSGQRSHTPTETYQKAE